MRVTRVSLRDFRNIERAEVRLGTRATVVSGPNGAGKTNLLEAIYFGCTAHAARSTNERELLRRGSEALRVEVDVEGDGESHSIEVGFVPGEPKRVRVDGAPEEGLLASEARPLVSVFLPDRLELVKGSPGLRRRQLDRLVAALWPARAETRAGYSRALAQRNALLARVRSGAAGQEALDAWDRRLAELGAQLMAVRREAAGLLGPLFAERGTDLGLPGPAELRYRPRSAAEDADGLVAELAERRGADLERGFTAHGPHRDELQLLLGSASLRAYGSQGQQRTAVLALLFAERDLLAERRRRPPLMLLDDVMSELDSTRRERLAELLRAGGQAVLSATDRSHVPLAEADGVCFLEVMAGRVSAAEAADGAVAA
jgi:DNA replication and repair protein RecF